MARLLWRLPLTTITPPPGSSQGPARPIGAGRFTLALTGSEAAEYPPTKGNAATVGARGVCVWPGTFPAWVGVLAGSAQRSFAGCGGCRPRSGRISLTPAVYHG